MYSFTVKTRPVCVHCGRKCGRKYNHWPAGQMRPSPWDGTTWVHQYNPFCTLRCAFAYARKAYARHRNN